MKKIIIAIATLAILAGGSITAFFIVKNQQDEISKAEIEKANENVLFSFSSDDVNVVEIDCPDGQYITEYTGESWQFTNTDEFVANQDYIINVISYMSTLEAEKSFGSSKEADLTKYGLDSPITITCKTNESDHTIYIGDPTPTNEAYYCMVEGRDDIYSIEYSYGSVLYANKSLLKSKYMLTYSDSEITGFELLRGDEVIYEVEKDESNIWHFIGEHASLKVNSTKISAMISVLTRLKAEEFIEEDLADYSKYGFDKPYAQMKITGSDGKNHSLLFSYYGDDPDYVYILIEESKQVSKYYALDVDYIENTLLDVAVTQIYATYLNTITGLDIDYKGEKIDFDVDSANGKYILNGEDISEYGDDVINNFNSMYNQLSALYFSGVDYDAKVSGEPAITITYHLNDNTDTVMEFIPINADEYWLVINGEYTNYIVSETTISGSYSFMYWYEKLLTSIEEFKL